MIDKDGSKELNTANHRGIELVYCRPGSMSGLKVYASGSKRFGDWYQVADWLKQSLEVGPVLICDWYYV